jgi:hypothetical protein
VTPYGLVGTVVMPILFLTPHIFLAISGILVATMIYYTIKASQ